MVAVAHLNRHQHCGVMMSSLMSVCDPSFKKVVEEEKEKTLSLPISAKRHCVITTYLEITAPHNKCTALKYTDISMWIGAQLKHVKRSDYLNFL